MKNVRGYVLTVPMRNGNAQKENTWVDELLGSYRTYEEWKLFSMDFSGKALSRSYRTYEEWKLTYIEVVQKHLKKVLTVPMRNGNGTYLTQLETYLAEFLPYL